jgi:hypothetical protein
MPKLTVFLSQQSAFKPPAFVEKTFEVRQSNFSSPQKKSTVKVETDNEETYLAEELTEYQNA